MRVRRRWKEYGDLALGIDAIQREVRIVVGSDEDPDAVAPEERGVSLDRHDDVGSKECVRCSDLLGRQ